MDHKGQHWAPKSYLEAWIDPSTPSNYAGYVWRFSKDGSIQERRAPKKIFKASNFYTRTASDGSRDLSLEHKLSTIESSFASTRKHKLNFHQDLTLEDRSNIIVFISVMLHRTKLRRDNEENKWNYLLKVMDDRAECIRNNPLHPPLSPLQSINRQNSMSHEDVRKRANEPMAKLITQSSVTGEFLAKMNMHIICAPENSSFITSDHPCVVFDPFYTSKHIALGCPSVEITFPISPKQMIIFFWDIWKQPSGYAYTQVEKKDVDEFNRRTCSFCNEYFIANDKVKNDFWFE